MLAKLNPFRGLDRPREVWAWGMYDLANQSFTLLINTLLFALYFKDVVVGPKGPGDALWGRTFAFSMLVVVVLSPVVGALGDAWSSRKRFLIGTGIGCCVLTGAFALLGPGRVWLAILLYVPANLLYQVGENFLASFLPGVSTPRTIGRVSATGWAMGYAGALILLVVVAVLMKVMGWGEVSAWRPFFVLAGAWFALNMIPAALFLREPASHRATRSPTIVQEAFRRLMTTARNAGRNRQLVRFLISFFVFGMGVQVIIAFASIIAVDFGFDTVKLVLFVLQLTVTAGAAAIATGLFQDRIGARTTVFIYLGVWIVSTAALLAIALIPDCPEWTFWVVGNGIGFGIGGIGTASRSLVGRFAPSHRTAEVFGFWGMVYKLAGVGGVFAFGELKTWIGMPAALGLLMAFFAGGLVLLLRVNERAGYREARRIERDELGRKADGAAATIEP